MSKGPPPPPGAERRRHPRYKMMAQVETTQGGEVSVLKVANLSAGGTLLELGTGEWPSVRVGDRLEVFLDAGTDEAGEPLTLHAEAEVVRLNLGGSGRPGGLALMWCSEDPAVAAGLARLLEAAKRSS